MKAPAAGSLRHAITIQEQTSAQDSFGEQTTSWTDVLDTRASIIATSKGEYFQSAFIGQISHEIVLRWPGEGVGIRTGMRVVSGPDRYRVQNVENWEKRNRWLILSTLAMQEGHV